MSSDSKTSLKLAAALFLGASAVAGCSTPGDVPVEYLAANPLERNAIGVRQGTEVLEIQVEPGDAILTVAEKSAIEAFIVDYRRVGSGPLIMSLPSGGANAQSAVRNLAEVRQIAYDMGVNYADIAGTNYNATGQSSAPIVIAYRGFEAVPPECDSLATINMADIESNNELPNFGCAMRTNLAAMIDDPSDLLGERELGEADVQRRQQQLEEWRGGAQ